MTIRVSYLINDRDCRECGGNGIAKYPPPPVCPVCRGSGQRATTEHDLLSLFNKCMRCNGRGYIDPTPCPDCWGRGTRQRELRLDIAIPAGATSGTRLHIPNQGHGSGNGQERGDFYLEVTVAEHAPPTRNFTVLAGENAATADDRTAPLAADDDEWADESFASASEAPIDEPRYEQLLEAALPEIYRDNPFRLLGLTVYATERDLKRQAEKLEMARKFGGGFTINGPLAQATAPDLDRLREATQRLREPGRRIIDELFWFWPMSASAAGDDPALAALARGEAQAAVAHWLDVSTYGVDQRVGQHNLAIYHHVVALDNELDGTGDTFENQTNWRSAFSRWRWLLEGDAYWEQLAARCAQMDDPRLTRATAAEMRATLPLAILKISASLAARAAERGDSVTARRHVDLIQQSGFAPQVIEAALREAAFPLRERLRTLCESSEEATSESVEAGHRAIERMVGQIDQPLAALDILLPQAGGLSALREDAHDQVALTVFRCESQYADQTDDYQTALDWVERTHHIAASTAAKEKIADYITSVRNYLNATRCWFCQQRNGTEAAKIKINMYGNVQTSYTAYNTRQVNYEHTAVPVPRCDGCRRAHRRTRAYGVAGVAGGVLLALLIFLAVNAITGYRTIAVGSVVGYAIAGAVIYAIGHFASERLPTGCLIALAVYGTFQVLALILGFVQNAAQPHWPEVLIITAACTAVGFDAGRRFGLVGTTKGLKPKRAGKSHPLVKQYVSRGWTFSPPRR